MVNDAIGEVYRGKRETANSSSFIANRIISRICKADIGRMEILLPNGNSAFHQGTKEGHNVFIHFKSWKGLLQYALLGEMSFVDAYIDGDIHIANLTALFNWYLDNEKYLARDKKNNWIMDLLHRFAHLIINDNNRRGAKKNISYHYDLGNEFYKKWLDRTMTYSAGIFNGEVSLANAQEVKYSRIIDQLDLKTGDSVFEIGCGWGGFAESLLSHNAVSYKGITISKEQLDYANDRINKLTGRNDLVKFEDYRDTGGAYDKIVSIEMFEAVGEKHWDTYFDTLRRRLKPGGAAVIQVITIDHDRYLKYRDRVDFIQKYIFPGGMLPSKEMFLEHAKKAKMTITNQFAFGDGYAETLRCWKAAFIEHWEDIKPLGFDDKFYRMWLYYLDYCEAAFERGTIDVMHFTLMHDQEE